jgi:hypothetical protein
MAWSLFMSNVIEILELLALPDIFAGLVDFDSLGDWESIQFHATRAHGRFGNNFTTFIPVLDASFSEEKLTDSRNASSKRCGSS